MVFKPNRNEYDGLMLEYSSTCELDKLVDVLAHYHLQDTEYPSRFEFMNKFDYRRERLKVLLLTKNDEKQFSINDETVYKYYFLNDYSDETELRPVTCPCVNLSEFAEWAIKAKFPCPQVILDKAGVSSDNQQIEGRDVYESDSSQDNIDQADEGRENDDMAHQPEIAQDDETPAATKSPGREPGNFTKLVTHVFNKLPELKKFNLAKRSNIREFIILIKEMTTPNSRLSDTFVMDLVKSVTIPDDGPCTIMMNDYSKLIGENEIRIKGKKYNNNHVSQVISRVRKKLIKNNA